MAKHVRQEKYQPKTSLIPQDADKLAKIRIYPSFSFKYLNLDHEKFSIDDREMNYFKKLLNRLQDLSKMPLKELKLSYNRTLRCHQIKWSDTTEPCFGIPNEDELVECPWQFSISVNEHGRVMGFFIGDVFYIVWLDPNHNLYD